MLAQVEARDATVAAHNTGLEREVAARTEELWRANLELRDAVAVAKTAQLAAESASSSLL